MKRFRIPQHKILKFPSTFNQPKQQMGIIQSTFKALFGKEERRILMLGLDAAGKTTVLYKLKSGEVICTTPTIGFNVETLQYRNIKFTVWDIGGQDRIRRLWRHYYEGTHALIYIVDSNDRERIEESAMELHNILRDEALVDACVLVLANKQDLPNAVGVRELIEKLGMHELRERPWKVQAACGVSGEGIYEGMEWLSNAVRNRNM
eukprot:TRINITY_DN1350_c0_g1_i2.p1 TRINITY_DN1350_c0_g1~~TRINITY_DN1350_c0_g1_i2.p1  ORF type:complete len:206 (-),score=34.55 TRINITY_DN1350_c0_g1_i2:20-637(-)